MTPDQLAGLLENSSEREFITLVLGVIISGVFTFALAWKMLSTNKDVIVRLIEWKDTPEEQEGESDE